MTITSDSLRPLLTLVARQALLSLMLGFGLLAPQPARSASKDQALEIKGRVLDPDGQPLSGAKVYLSTYNGKDKSDPKIRAVSDPDGRFVFPAGRAEVDRGEMVVAEADRYGPDWISLKEVGNKNELTLRLVKDDVPIKGRVLDLEGRPIAGATVRLGRVQKTPGEDLTAYLKELQANPGNRIAVIDAEFRFSRNTTSVIGLLGSLKPVNIGADGRFEMRGFGRERVVQLSIEGPGIESRYVAVMTRSGVGKGLPMDRHGPVFDHLAAPSKPIRGTVREKGTGKPLAGISVHVRFPFNILPVVLQDHNAATDEQGRYQIDGIGKHTEYTVSAGGRPYFNAIKDTIADTPGLEPLVVDLELERGIEITGHVRNKATGEPLRNAVVNYHVLADNPNFNKLSGLALGNPIRRSTQDFTLPDGSFAVVGLPGPGYLVVLATEDDYRKAAPPVDLKTVAPPVRYRPPLVHAWVRIDPSEKDPKSTQFEIALEPVKSITVQALDPQGKPLSGYFVAGLSGISISLPKELNLHETPSFRIRGVDPDRPRTLAIIHPEKRLGKVLTVRDNQQGPLQVQLEPLGAVTGRVVDGEGRPQSGLQLRATASFDVKDENLLPMYSKLPLGLRQHRMDLPTRTDNAGKFHLDGWLPGIKYFLLVSESDTKAKRRVVLRLTDLTVESGKTKDLGDLKINTEPRP